MKTVEIKVNNNGTYTEFPTNLRNEIKNKLIENIEGLTVVEDTSCSNTTYLKLPTIEGVYIAITESTTGSSTSCNIGIANDTSNPITSQTGSSYKNNLSMGKLLNIGGYSKIDDNYTLIDNLYIYYLDNGFVMTTANNSDLYLGYFKSSKEKYYLAYYSPNETAIKAYLYNTSNADRTTKLNLAHIVPSIYIDDNGSAVYNYALNVSFKEDGKMFLMNPYLLETYITASGNTILDEYIPDIFCTCTRKIDAGKLYSINDTEYIAIGNDVLVKNITE